MPKSINSMHVGCKFRYRQQDNFVTLKFINDDIVEENNNIFVIIVKAISSFIKAIFQTILNIISKLVSSISSFKCI